MLWPASVIPQPKVELSETLFPMMRLPWFGPTSSLTSMPPPRPPSRVLPSMVEPVTLMSHIDSP